MLDIPNLSYFIMRKPIALLNVLYLPTISISINELFLPDLTSFMFSLV